MSPPRGVSKREGVVDGRGGAGGREAGAVYFEGVLELSDGGEEELSVPEGTEGGHVLLVGGDEQLWVLGEEHLDHEEGGGVVEREGLGQGQGELKRLGHRAPLEVTFCEQWA